MTVKDPVGLLRNSIKVLKIQSSQSNGFLITYKFLLEAKKGEQRIVHILLLIIIKVAYEMNLLTNCNLFRRLLLNPKFILYEVVCVIININFIIIIDFIIIKKSWQCKAEREWAHSILVRRPQPHQTNPSKEGRRENSGR